MNEGEVGEERQTPCLETVLSAKLALGHASSLISWSLGLVYPKDKEEEEENDDEDDTDRDGEDGKESRSEGSSPVLLA